MTTFYHSEDVIAALATPPGEGGIAIIRLSGKGAIEIASRFFSGPIKRYESHTAHLGAILFHGKPIDEALVLVMRSPRSYTGEDVVEFHCHGGMYLAKKVLDAAIASGARLAKPGEFTFRAFMHGKLDLSQAEAVQALIGAKNEQALHHAKQHLSGELSKKIIAIQDQLLHIAAILEAWVDFPEEGLEFCSLEELADKLSFIGQQLQALLDTYEDGKKLFCGISLAIIGEPNAGKSSLLNQLLDEERAIVTPIAGTTRDLLHEEVLIGGISFRLTDTAGLRDTDDLIEQEGIKRARKAAELADWILAVIDLTRPLPNLLATLPLERTLIVWNKIDLALTPICYDAPYQVCLSAKTGEGIALLKEKLTQLVWQKKVPSKDEVILTSQRHFEAIYQAKQAVDVLRAGLLHHRSPEWLTADVRQCLQSLAQVLGQDVTDEVLSKIFSTFCVGK